MGGAVGYVRVFAARVVEEERNTYLYFAEVAVCVPSSFVVLVKFLSMVASYHHYGIVKQPFLLQFLVNQSRQRVHFSRAVAI